MRAAIAFLVGFVFLVTSAAAQSTVTGVVRDESGGVVSGASVVLRAGGVDRQTVTGPDGRFTLEGPSGRGELVVRAGGFAERVQPLSGEGAIDVVLEPARVLEAVTVTPTRTEQRIGDVPASVTIIDSATIERSPAVVADDVLRLVPTFSLFRRTSSLSSHPTTQGVSLRGVGPSGVSRSLVLLDGVPFNDPFGGWVYWTRVPLDSVDRIEIVEGTSSNVYGNYGLGGVINILSARPQPRTLELGARYGTRQSPKADFFASDVWGALGASIDGSLFSTDGFPIVIAGERGPIDTKATVDYHALNLKIDYGPGDRVNLWLRGGYFREERDNAKFSTFDGSPERNDTRWRAVSGGARITLPDSSDLQARVFADFSRFHSNFLAVPNLTTRAIGRMSLLQRVPTTAVGGMVQWARAVSSRHLFTAGTDWRWIDGASHEQALDTVTGTTVTLLRESGGTQLSSGAYAQGQLWPASNVSITLSGRVDRWRNSDARNLETTVATGLPTANNRRLPDKDDSVFSPRAAVLFQPTGRVTAWGSLGWGFRAPTLNELYRQFRVGALLTLANDQLGPERVLGGEAGVNVVPVSGLNVRATWFDNRLRNSVSNVTRTDLVNTLQRQNLGGARVQGLQAAIEYRAGTGWRFGGGYMYNHARVTAYAANPALVGKTIPQVPSHRGSVSMSYSNPRYVTVSVSALLFGRQYDDDLNSRTQPGASVPGLPPYGVLDLTAVRSVGRRLDAFFGVQNLFDQQYLVGLAPTTIGSPRLVNGGIRVRWTGR